MGVEQIGWAILGRILGGVLGPKLLAWLQTRQLPRPIKRRLAINKYLADLPEQLMRMPFIYRGLETHVLTDFVEVDVERLDLRTLSPKTHTRAFQLGAIELFKNRRQVAILGSAGIGKTTYQRHNILSILKGDRVFLHDSEYPLPVYVPLKIVPNANPSPIYKHICQSAPFEGDAQFLLDCVRTKGFFLCLDGYDEIALTGMKQNHIQDELRAILFTGTSHSSNPEGLFYAALTQPPSRVWLTSRPQFMEHHPIGPLASRSSHRTTHVAAVGITGISNREALTQAIFDRYAAAGLDASNLLNAEYFLQQIDRAVDGEIREMSFNPLFLTVMSYNYAQVVLDKARHDVSLAATFEELILECVDLLLIDLDEYKARQLSPVERSAIGNRRNEFIPEKRAYLRFLAADSYVRSVSVFTEVGMADVLTRFLEDGVDETVAAKIRRTFEETATDRPSFIRQLIYCGLFVRVDLGSNEAFYDFPHRRFREVLACAYLVQPAEYVKFLAELEKGRQGSFSELISVLNRSTKFKSASWQRQSLDFLLDDMLRRSPAASNYVRLCDAYLDLLPVGCDIGPVLSAFVDRLIEMRRPAFETSARLLKFYQADSAQLDKLEGWLRQVYDVGDLSAVGLACTILRALDQRRLVAIIRELLKTNQSRQSCALLLANLAAIAPNEFVDVSRALATNGELKWAVVDGLWTTPRGLNVQLAQECWKNLDSDTRLQATLYASTLVAEFEDAVGTWRRFARAVGFKRDHQVLLAVRQLTTPAEGDLFCITTECIGDLLRSVDALLRSRDVMDTPEFVPGKALPLKQEVKLGDPNRDIFGYADEATVRGVCRRIESSLGRESYRLTKDLSVAANVIHRELQRLEQLVEFGANRAIVAFAAQGRVLTCRELAEDLVRQLRSGAILTVDELRVLIQGWLRTPKGLPRLPRFFVERLE